MFSFKFKVHRFSTQEAKVSCGGVTSLAQGSATQPLPAALVGLARTADAWWTLKGAQAPEDIPYTMSRGGPWATFAAPPRWASFGPRWGPLVRTWALFRRSCSARGTLLGGQLPWAPSRKECNRLYRALHGNTGGSSRSREDSQDPPPIAVAPADDRDQVSVRLTMRILRQLDAEFAAEARARSRSSRRALPTPASPALLLQLRGR